MEATLRSPVPPFQPTSSPSVSQPHLPSTGHDRHPRSGPESQQTADDVHTWATATVAAPLTTPGSMKKKQQQERARMNEFAEHLKVRLQYAMLKVDHGWVHQSLPEVENLYYHHYRSPARPLHPPGSTSNRPSPPALAPPAEIVEGVGERRADKDKGTAAFQAHGRRRGTVSFAVAGASAYDVAEQAARTLSPLGGGIGLVSSSISQHSSADRANIEASLTYRHSNVPSSSSVAAATSTATATATALHNNGTTSYADFWSRHPSSVAGPGASSVVPPLSSGASGKRPHDSSSHPVFAPEFKRPRREPHFPPSRVGGGGPIADDVFSSPTPAPTQARLQSLSQKLGNGDSLPTPLSPANGGGGGGEERARETRREVRGKAEESDGRMRTFPPSPVSPLVRQA